MLLFCIICAFWKTCSLLWSNHVSCFNVKVVRLYVVWGCEYKLLAPAALPLGKEHSTFFTFWTMYFLMSRRPTYASLIQCAPLCLFDRKKSGWAPEALLPLWAFVTCSSVNLTSFFLPFAMTALIPLPKQTKREHFLIALKNLIFLKLFLEMTE